MNRGQEVSFDNGETVLYSGLAGDDAPHEKSVALILSKAAGKSLKEREPISERIISAMFESEHHDNAPTNETEENLKEDFHHQLQTAFNKRKTRDLTMVIGEGRPQCEGRLRQ